MIKIFIGCIILGIILGILVSIWLHKKIRMMREHDEFLRDNEGMCEMNKILGAFLWVIVMMMLILVCIPIAKKMGFFKVETTKIEITIKTPGQIGYARQQVILDAFSVELMGRTWNAVPSWQPWLKKYIVAVADSGFSIKCGQKIEFGNDNPLKKRGEK